MSTQSPLYAGVDLHKSYSYVTVMDHQGYIHYQGKHQHQGKTLIPLLQELPQPVLVSMESTYGWYAQADEFETQKIPFVLAHPTKINAIAGKKKTDKEDSKILADLHRTNLLPLAYVPSKPQREWRQLVRFRLQLVQNQTILKTRVRDLLQKQRLTCPYRDILGQKSLSWFKEHTFPPVYQKQLHSLFKQAQLLKKEIEEYQSLIDTWVKHDGNAKLLQSIPGIGPTIAGVIMAEIGEISRFPHARCFAAYCGVTPSVKSSGGKTYLGKTNQHASPYLRWCLAEAVIHLIKKDPTVKQKYDRLVVTKGKGKAKVALMNKLARIIFAVLKRKSPYYVEALPPSD